MSIKSHPLAFTIKQTIYMHTNYTGYNVDQLLNDDYFAQWLLSPNAENEAFWSELREKDQVLKSEIDAACSLVMHLQQDIKRPEFSLQEETVLWSRIKEKTNENKRKKNIFRLFRIIAGTAAVICLSFFAVRELYLKDKQDINYLAIIESVDQASKYSKEVELVLSNNRKITILEKESQVEYKLDGDINVNSKKIEHVIQEKSPDNTLNQLIVPHGKRSSVTFSDGTKIWVNSGSKVIYPVAFEKEQREIFIEGEVYLDVTANAEWPFVVKTQQMNVKVLGTRFNVSAYKNESNLQVTLVEGKVEVKTNSNRSEILSPSQLFDYDTQTKEVRVQAVDVDNYVTWKNGYYQFERQPLNIVFKKLSQYYGIWIEWDEEVGKRTCYGKLDLKEELDDVLNNLKDATAIPMQFARKDNCIKISMNP